MAKTIELKKINAEKIIRDCIGKKGIWASPTRYQDQCWTRDFSLAGLEALLSLGDEVSARKHLEELCRRQTSEGKIPILYFDNAIRCLTKKIWKTVTTGKMSYILKRSRNVADLTPWTTDSEVNFVIAMHEYAAKTQDYQFLQEHRFSVQKAMSYIENNRLRNKLHLGGDWRDVMTQLEEKALLSNNCLLYRAYSLSGEDKKASKLKGLINTHFWNGQHYQDYSHSNSFDTLGQSLAILFELVPKERYASILRHYKVVECKYGYMTNNLSPAPLTKEERLAIEKTNQYSIMWPFITGYAIQALDKMGESAKAQEMLKRWTAQDGFYEWYYPESKTGSGSNDQLWSAALYLQTANVLERTKPIFPKPF